MSKNELACSVDPDTFTPNEETRKGNPTPLASVAIGICLNSCGFYAQCLENVKKGLHDDAKGIIAGLTTAQREKLRSSPNNRFA